MPGVYEYAAISRVQQANDIVDVVSEHVSLKKKGRELVGLCPFHEDHKPSLYVNPVKQIYKCFACGFELSTGGGETGRARRHSAKAGSPYCATVVAEGRKRRPEPVGEGQRLGDGILPAVSE